MGTYVLAHVRRGKGATYEPTGELARTDSTEYVAFDGVAIHLRNNRALIPHGTIDCPFGDGHGKREEYVLGVEKSVVQY
jgi:hypothetical protein